MIIPWSFKKLGRVKPFSHPPYVEWKRCYVEDVVRKGLKLCSHTQSSFSQLQAEIKDRAEIAGLRKNLTDCSTELSKRWTTK